VVGGELVFSITSCWIAPLNSAAARVLENIKYLKILF
jgi:hypothetical protein